MRGEGLGLRGLETDKVLGFWGIVCLFALHVLGFGVLCASLPCMFFGVKIKAWLEPWGHALR